MEKAPNLSTQSLSSVPIEMYYSETSTLLANGTGFFFRVNERIFLITNWHNLTGINPETKKTLSNHAGKPDTIRLPLLKTTDTEISSFMCDIKIYSDDYMELPIWYVHPTLREKVDIVALEFNVPDGLKCIAINDSIQNFKEFNPSIADDVYILGFPYKLKQEGIIPIWKRASIASEPEFDYNGKAIILVDTASRPGMSGSPVLLRRNSIWKEPDVGIGTRQCFLGVYSGRITGNTELEAQLGIVWKKHLIEEIISGERKDEIKNFT